MTRLLELIEKTTQPLRKGSDLIIDGEAATDEQRQEFDQALIKGETPRVGSVVEIMDYPHVSAVKPDVPVVDVHFFTVAVNLPMAEENRADILAGIKALPCFQKDGEVSYIELGAELGDQEFALRLMGLGEALKIWRVYTPDRVLGDSIPQDMKNEMAGMGFVTVPWTTEVPVGSQEG